MRVKQTGFILLLLLLSASLSLGASSRQIYTGNPWMDATGGPDAYGYTWIDSDEPGGPTYEWVDITAIGTQVTGLGDDNYSGPFSLGFDYDYYWYTISEVYVGSNGYLKIPPAANLSQTFPSTIPLTAAPNDFMAVYTMDLDFTPGGEAYYWTNNVDQFIVSFINVPAWDLGGSHTFQVILDNSDHTITYNYGFQEGTVSNGDILIGIENQNGQVGLLHSADSYVPHNDYTVVFTRPDTTAYEVHDMSANDVVNEGSLGSFITPGEDFSPTVWAMNAGNQPETDVVVRAGVKNSGGTYEWFEEYTIASIAAGEMVEVNFTSSWTSGATGPYTIDAQVILDGDMNPNNDMKTAELNVVEIPGELLYDDNGADTYWSWLGGNGGIGQRFVPPTYPAEITLIRYYISASTVTDFIARVYDDDGPDGFPGTLLFETTVNVPGTSGWYNANVTGVVLADGAFYVSWEMTGDNTTQIGLDSNAPFSRNTWEYTGVWSPFRNAEINDAMIRCMVGQGVIPEPLIAVSADTIDFGVVDTMQTVTEDFTIYSIGNVDLTVDDITFTNNPGGLFFTLNGFIPGTVIPVGDSLELTIDFHPPIPSVLSSDMNIQSDSYVNPLYTVFVTGEGFDPNFVKEHSEIPVDFELAQNVPNPFNPVTNIEYSLPKDAHVKLVVYNVLGKEIARLVDTNMQAGYHSVAFDGVNLGSGVYFYKISAGEFTDMKKMVLMK